MQPVSDTSAIDEAQSCLLAAESELAGYRDDVELREVIGREAWLAGLRTRRSRVEEAEVTLARARLDTPQQAPELHELVEDFPGMSIVDQRHALAVIIDCIGLRSRTAAGSIDERAVIFWAGSGPRDLPRRGFREKPELRPFQLAPLPAVHAA